MVAEYCNLPQPSWGGDASPGVDGGDSSTVVVVTIGAAVGVVLVTDYDGG